MIKKNKVWRPQKVFKLKPKEDIVRPRWRPRKEVEKEKNKILKIDDISSITKKIKFKSNIDKITRWLLLFSVILLIFSIMVKNNSNQEKEVIDEITSNIQIEKQEIKTPEKTTTWQRIQAPQKQDDNLRPLSQEEELIFNFYKDINESNFNKLWDYMDINLKRTDVYRIYFNQDWLSNFISNISNNTLFIISIKEIPNEWSKAKKYEYQLKYKLKNDDTLFTENRNISIVYKDNIPLIWSIMCTTTWCSKNPFFNPQRYWIK